MTTCELLPRELTPPAPSPRDPLRSQAGAGLLFADAWFDVCTSAAGTARLLAVGEALC